MKKAISPRRLCAAALMLALGVVLPQAFHAFGGRAVAGILLPMHIPVLLGGLLLGPSWGLALGVLCPLLSSLVTGMPPMDRLPLMLCELAIYGLVAGFCMAKKCNVCLSLLAAQILGRIAYSLALLFCTGLLGMDLPPVATVWTAFLAGVPGLVIQWAFLPALVLLTKRVIDLESCPSK
ncbi:MAG: ECF transporter S component [Oscillospiraceae bacterium]